MKPTLRKIVRERVHNYVLKKPWGGAELEAFHLKEKLRIRSRRERKKQQLLQGESSQSQSSPYRSNQAKGKAVKRAVCSLPASPHKRLCVVETLAKTVGLNLDNTPARDSSSISISDELVIGFYNSNDVSWQAPGRKDRIIVRESDTNGKKTKRTEQVRYLLMSLKEAYSKFAEKTH